MKKKKVPKEKIIIGTLDKADFPDLQLEEIDCKIDTGAATSAIHCHEIKVLEKEGKEVLSFKLLDPDHPAYNHKRFYTSQFQLRKVRSSSGHLEERYVITTRVVLFKKTYKTQFTLADRVKMRYPVLLGKKLLHSRFLVDVALKNLSWKQKNTNTEGQ